MRTEKDLKEMKTELKKNKKKKMAILVHCRNSYSYKVNVFLELLVYKDVSKNTLLILASKL